MVLRKCLGCGNIDERSNLIRLLKDHKSYELIIMPTSEHFGRSAYLCYNVECVKTALKKKRFNRALGKTPSDEIIHKIQELIK